MALNTLLSMRLVTSSKPSLLPCGALYIPQICTSHRYVYPKVPRTQDSCHSKSTPEESQCPKSWLPDTEQSVYSLTGNKGHFLTLALLEGRSIVEGEGDLGESGGEKLSSSLHPGVVSFPFTNKVYSLTCAGWYCGISSKLFNNRWQPEGIYLAC